MYGVPKTVKTANDLERIHGMALEGRLPKERVAKHWQGLLNGKDHYVFDRKLSDSEDPDGSPPDYIVLDVKQEDGTTERHQYQLQEDPNASIFELGYTVSKVNAKLNELGV
jgi:hypothetical protein